MRKSCSAVIANFGEQNATIDKIRGDLRTIRIDLDEIKGKLSNVPTTFQLVFMQAALILAIFVGAFGLLKLAAPH